MGCFVRSLIFVAILGVLGAVAAKPIQEKLKERRRPDYKTEKVTRGTVESFVMASGKIKPIETIKIGSFISGPIENMPPEIDFNSKVKENDLLCQVDPRLIQAQADSARASLKSRQGDLERTKAQLQLAKNDEQRAIKLRQKKRDFVSQAEMDQLTFGRMQLEAALLVAEASVEQANAQLTISETNLEYTDIRSPKDGIIIDRKIEPGQTLAAQFQTPELFEIGVDLDKRVHIYASVNESEIGLIRKAQEAQEAREAAAEQAEAVDPPVTFTVNAYRDEVFQGRIIQIRMSATETQSVVTYPVIVEAKNEELKLLPSMTADLSFKVEERNDVLRIPNQSLIYLPKKEFVREEDQKILDGSAWNEEKNEEEEGDDDDDSDEDESETSGDTEADSKPMETASARAKKNRNRSKKHVWVKEGDKLRAVEIVLGLADQGEDGRTTEILSGDLKEGDEIVVGEKPKKMSWFGG